MRTMLVINDELQIPLAEIDFRYSRSGGPGGQHVNKSETQVELLWDIANSPSVSEGQRHRLLTTLANRIDNEGILHLSSGQTRSQERNRQAVTERFVHVLQGALRPRKVRRKTKVSMAQKRRRLEQKRRRSELKKLRREIE